VEEIGLAKNTNHIFFLRINSNYGEMMKKKVRSGGGGGLIELLCLVVFLCAVTVTVLGQNPVKIQEDDGVVNIYILHFQFIRLNTVSSSDF